jgi:hypothetical protein
VLLLSLLALALLLLGQLRLAPTMMLLLLRVHCQPAVQQAQALLHLVLVVASLLLRAPALAAAAAAVLPQS